MCTRYLAFTVAQRLDMDNDESCSSSQQKLKRIVVEDSIAEALLEAQKECALVGVCRKPNYCICDMPIVENMEIRNVHNNNLLIVGNVCVNRFANKEWDDAAPRSMWRSLKNLHMGKRERPVSQSLLNLAVQIGVIKISDRDWYVKCVSGFRSWSRKQCEIKIKVENLIALGMSRKRPKCYCKQPAIPKKKRKEPNKYFWSCHNWNNGGCKFSLLYQFVDRLFFRVKQKMNRFESLSDLILATVLRKLPRRNGRSALALASQRLADVYKRNCTWIERPDQLAARMQQLWRAKHRPLSHTVVCMGVAFTALAFLVHRLGFDDIACVGENNVIDLGQLDLSCLNPATFSHYLQQMDDRFTVSVCADVLRRVEFCFEANSLRRIDLVIGSDIIATRYIGQSERNCILFLDFPIKAVHYNLCFDLRFRDNAKSKNVDCLAVFSYSANLYHALFDRLISFVNPQRWDGAFSARHGCMMEKRGMVDHTPLSVRKEFF